MSIWSFVSNCKGPVGARHIQKYQRKSMTKMGKWLMKAEALASFIK